jgi:hypothetical protein
MQPGNHLGRQVLAGAGLRVNADMAGQGIANPLFGSGQGDRVVNFKGLAGEGLGSEMDE